MEASDNGRNERPNDSLKCIGNLFNKFGWDKKLSDLSKEEILMFIMLIQTFKPLKEEIDETYLACVWLKYTLEEK